MQDESIPIEQSESEPEAVVQEKPQPEQTETIAERSRVIYLGHIPHGFYEKQMKEYFSQFGNVTRLRLARSKKTNNSKGFAFIEFEDADVAEIAAKTMNNYILYGRKLLCHVYEKPTTNLFYSTYAKLSKRNAIKKFNKIKTMKQIEKNVKRALKSEESIKQKLSDLGLSYNFIDLSSKALPSKRQHVKYAQEAEEDDE